MSKTYEEIIADNVKRYGVVAKYAYHYTDISNIVSILSEGCLYSRQECNKKSLMINDNASSSVISNTNNSTKNDVRFYFRPLTPTQYHNEGYKHPSIRFGADLNANVPVPIFFLFDLAKMLKNLRKLGFTEIGRAGKDSVCLCYGIDSFQNLPFSKIYSNGVYTREQGDLKLFRHAELAFPNSFEFLPYLRHIVCRNAVEGSSLWNLLNDHSLMQFAKYGHVEKSESLRLFERNGLFVDTVYFHTTHRILTIVFSNESSKKNYHRKYCNSLLTSIEMEIHIKYGNSDNGDSEYYKLSIDYLDEKRKSVSIHGDWTSGMKVKIYFNKSLMAYVSFLCVENNLWLCGIDID